MSRKIERQIRYNMTTDIGEQEDYRYKYIFFIINEPREIHRIRERIWKEMEPIVGLSEISEGLIKNSRGLHYRLFSFSTSKGEIENSQKIYDVHNDGRFTKDRNLQDKMTDGLSLWING